MFQILEDYIADYEKNLLSDYLNAKRAYNEWASAKKTQMTTLVFNSPIYEDLWRYHSRHNVSERAKHIITEFTEGSAPVTVHSIIDIITIDSNDYEVVVGNVVLSNHLMGGREERYYTGRVEEAYSTYNGYKKFLADRHVYEQDVELVKFRSDEWIEKRAKSDAEKHRKWIEDKIRKMLDEVDTIEELPDDGWLVKGTNGKTAHMWFVAAGGYNIQRLHTRCLIKEVKNV